MRSETTTTNSNDILVIGSKKITLILSYEGEEIEIKCNLKDKVKKVLKSYAKQYINEEFSHLAFLYSGKMLGKDDYKKKITDIISRVDRDNRKMNMIVNNFNTYTISNDFININLILDSQNPIILKGKKTETIKAILTRNASKIGKEINSFVFKYGDEEINLNKKFDDIVNDNDRKCSKMNINAIQNIIIVAKIKNYV